MVMTASDYRVLFEQLVDHEGLKTRYYRDTVGKITIGVGYNVSDRGLNFAERVIGREITPLEITREEALRILAADVERVEGEIKSKWSNYDALNCVRKRAVIDFVFNLGINRADDFTNAIRFANLAIELEKHQQKLTADPATRALWPSLVASTEAAWTSVAFHVMDSVWARQVDDGLGGRKGRADRLAVMFRTGRDPKVH